jgi:hypothetical protein
VSSVRYGLGLYVPEDDILHSHCRENMKWYIALTNCALWRRHKVSSVRYELGFYIQEDDILYLASCPFGTNAPVPSGKSGRRMKPATHLHLVPKLGKSLGSSQCTYWFG